MKKTDLAIYNQLGRGHNRMTIRGTTVTFEWATEISLPE